jgi:hypothetical protein
MHCNECGRWNKEGLFERGKVAAADYAGSCAVAQRVDDFEAAVEPV